MSVPAVILMYHRIATPSIDPFGLCVSPHNFREHVDMLTSNNWATPLSTVRSRPSGPRVVVTFDDGYHDNAVVAGPLLAAAGVPVTWFITVGCLDGQPFWWDQLAHSLLDRYDGPDSVELALGGRRVWVNLGTAEARRDALRLIHRRLLPLAPTVLKDQVDEVLAALGSRRAPEDARGMTTEQLSELASLPQSEIGGHTMTHARLKGQPAHIQRSEILGSVNALRELLGTPVRSFAYPFGGSSAVGPLAPWLVRQAGCALACTTRSGRVTPRSGRFTLPRLNVGDWSAERLQRALLEAN